MKRNALIAGGVAVILVAGLFVVLSTIDVNQYKDLVEEQAAAATGRTLTIEGDTDLSLSFTPAIVINGGRCEDAGVSRCSVFHRRSVAFGGRRFGTGQSHRRQL